MADYIEREALMKLPIRRDHCDKDHANEYFINGIETVMEYAENLPAADVVQKEEAMKHYTPIVTDDPQDNVEAALNLVFVKNSEVYVRGYGPAHDFDDARLYDMARDLLRKYSPETLENTDLSDDDELSCAIAEMLFDGTDTMDGVIALLYTMAWAFAETRERLRMYEETRLSPLDLKDRLIAPFQNDMFAMVWGAFKKLYPDKDCEIYWEPQIRDEEDGKPVYGLTDFADDGSVAVFVKPSLEVADAIEILAHELAHVAVGVEHDHDEVWQEAFDKIFEEYNRIGSQMSPTGHRFNYCPNCGARMDGGDR